MEDDTETTFGGPAEDWTPPPRVEPAPKMEAPAPPGGDVVEEPAPETAGERQRGPDGRFLPVAETPAPEAPQPEVPEAPKPDAAEQRWMQFMQAQEQRHAQEMRLLMQAIQQRQAPPATPPEPEVKFEDLDPMEQLAFMYRRDQAREQELVAMKQRLEATGQTTTQIRQQTYEQELARDLPAMAVKFPTLDRDDHAEIINTWQRAGETRSVIQIAQEYAATLEKKAQRWAAAKGLSARPAPPAAVRSSPPTPAANAEDKFAGINFDDQTDEGWNEGWRTLQRRIHGTG